LATNPVGSAELNIILRAIDPPTIVPTEGEEEIQWVQLNKPAFLQCQITGTEPIQVEWFYQDQSVAGTELDTQLESKLI
jgi:hypothetical protein